MNGQEFEAHLEEVISKIRDILLSKNGAYNAHEEKLGSFISAAKFKQETLAQALWGMQIKHLVSVNDMIQSESYYPLEVWDEKIFDVINYMILLRAIIVDEIPSQEASSDGEIIVQEDVLEEDPADEFVAAVFESPEFESALVRAFKQAFGDERPFVVHVNNYGHPQKPFENVSDQIRKIMEQARNNGPRA